MLNKYAYTFGLIRTKHESDKCLKDRIITYVRNN